MGRDMFYLCLQGLAPNHFTGPWTPEDMETMMEVMETNEEIDDAHSQAAGLRLVGPFHAVCVGLE